MTDLISCFRLQGPIVKKSVLALYYFDAARNKSGSFFAASILGRGFSTAALVVFWATGQPWQLLIFAGVELAGAIWTYTEMRAQAAR